MNSEYCCKCSNLKTEEYVKSCYRVSTNNKKSRKVSLIDILVFLFIIMAASTSVNAAYLNKIPVQYQTSYSTLLRKRRAELAINAKPNCMTAEEMQNCKVNCATILCPVIENGNSKSTKVPSKLRSLFQLITEKVAKKNIEEKNLKLAAIRKCQEEGLENSILCKLNYGDPTASAKIFHQILPKLMIQAEVNKTLPPNDNELDSGDNYGSNAADKNNRDQLTERIFQRRSPKFMTRKKRQSMETYREMCQTVWSTTPPTIVTHVSSNTDVELFVHHDQKFEVGQCKKESPVLTVNIVGDSQAPRCRVSRSKHFATFLIDPEVVDITNYKNCAVFMTNSSELAICRDWVYLNSSCRMYFVAPSIAK